MFSPASLIFTREFFSAAELAPLRTESGGGDHVQQPPAAGRMRIAGDVLVRRPRGGQRQDHPPRGCPGGVHARGRGSLPAAGG